MPMARKANTKNKRREILVVMNTIYSTSSLGYVIGIKIG